MHSSLRAWQFWESGERQMHPATWELFVRKAKLPRPEDVPTVDEDII